MRKEVKRACVIAAAAVILMWFVAGCQSIGAAGGGIEESITEQSGVRVPDGMAEAMGERVHRVWGLADGNVPYIAEEKRETVYPPHETVFRSERQLAERSGADASMIAADRVWIAYIVGAALVLIPMILLGVKSQVPTLRNLPRTTFIGVMALGGGIIALATVAPMISPTTWTIIALSVTATGLGVVAIQFVPGLLDNLKRDRESGKQ